MCRLIFEGEVFALAGESGSENDAGKILWAEQPDSGKYFAGEKRVDRKTEKETKYAWKVRMIFQDPYSSLNPCMTINEMLTETLRAKEKQIKFDQKERKKTGKDR